jgi:hypothetical protein
MSVLLGIVLAIGTWITLTTMIARGPNGGIVQNFGTIDAVLFLEISLTENWLIFITRANGPFWSSIPSWQLSGAILVVDLIATFFTLFGWFLHGANHHTSIVAVVRIWIFSFGIFCIMGGVYYLLQDSIGFDNLMHGKSPKKNQKQRSLEDFGKSLRITLVFRNIVTNSFHSCFASTCLHSARKVGINTSKHKTGARRALTMRAWLGGFSLWRLHGHCASCVVQSVKLALDCVGFYFSWLQKELVHLLLPARIAESEVADSFPGEEAGAGLLFFDSSIPTTAIS